MPWLFWSILSAVFAGATAILAKFGLTGAHSNTATAIRTSVVFLFSWMIVAASPGLPSVRQLPGAAWPALIASGVATGLSWLCYFRALQLGPASKVAPVDKLSLVIVVILAAIFLGEKISLRTALGVALVTTGVIVLALK